jgi:tetratricopeptide (TPR) repeat protein
MSQPQPAYQIITLNTLAFPKGGLPCCDLTGFPATCKLVSPHITLYYATRSHAEQAWQGIVGLIAPLLGPLQAGAAAVGSQEDRAKREYTVNRSKRTLIELCQQEAAKMLVNGRHELAVPGAVQALKFLKDTYGEGSIESVPAYLLLAEANLGLDKFRQCEEYLSLANWSVLKNPGCSDAIRSQLHRNFGKLYSAQGKLDQALQELAKDVYHSSLSVGPEHIDTSGGFFHMANLFYAQNKIDNALAFYDKVVDIWYESARAKRAQRRQARAKEDERGQRRRGRAKRAQRRRARAKEDALLLNLGVLTGAAASSRARAKKTRRRFVPGVLPRAAASSEGERSERKEDGLASEASAKKTRCRFVPGAPSTGLPASPPCCFVRGAPPLPPQKRG